MGTRHLILAYYHGKYYIAQYGQWDGYPSGQGVTILSFLQDADNTTRLKAALDNDKVFTPTEAQLRDWQEQADKLSRKEKLTPQQQLELQDFASKPMMHLRPSLARDTGAGILKMIADAEEPVPVQPEVDFIADGLFCEWAYVVDLDVEVFEVYGGHEEKSATDVGRLDDLECIQGIGSRPAMVATYAFSGLPKEADFLADCRTE